MGLILGADMSGKWLIFFSCMRVSNCCIINKIQETNNDAVIRKTEEMANMSCYERFKMVLPHAE